MNTSGLLWRAMNLSAGRTSEAAADDEDRRSPPSAFAATVQLTASFSRRVGEQRQQREQRNHGDVLEEQHRERLAAVVEPSWPRSASDASTSAVDDIARPKPATIAACHVRPSHAAMQAEHERGHATCAPPSPNTSRRMRPQPRGLELEADEEEQQRDAELGEAAHVLGVGDEAEAPRAEQHAGGEIAQHAAQLQPLEQRHEHDRRVAGRPRRVRACMSAKVDAAPMSQSARTASCPRRSTLRCRPAAGARAGSPCPSSCGRHAPRSLRSVNCNRRRRRGPAARARACARRFELDRDRAGNAPRLGFARERRAHVEYHGLAALRRSSRADRATLMRTMRRKRISR